jgi:hypothetical protein
VLQTATIYFALSSGSAFTNGAPSGASERTAHYHGRYQGVAGEWHLYAVAQHT